MFSNKTALLLDMNGTFMFGEDNFGCNEDFSMHYHDIGGGLTTKDINKLVEIVYSDLDKIYPDEQYRHNFPSIKNTINKISHIKLSEHETTKIIETFAYHEIGYVPDEYIDVLHSLAKQYRLALVIDIWSPKAAWLSLFNQLGINTLFSAASYSSDHGMVKPSPKPFELVVTRLGLAKEKCLMIGDSVRRDLGGANAAGLDCVLVGGAKHEHAIACYPNLVELSHDLLNN